MRAEVDRDAERGRERAGSGRNKRCILKWSYFHFKLPGSHWTWLLLLVSDWSLNARRWSFRVKDLFLVTKYPGSNHAWVVKLHHVPKNHNRSHKCTRTLADWKNWSSFPGKSETVLRVHHRARESEEALAPGSSVMENTDKGHCYRDLDLRGTISLSHTHTHTLTNTHTGVSKRCDGNEYSLDYRGNFSVVRRARSEWNGRGRIVLLQNATFHGLNIEWFCLNCVQEKKNRHDSLRGHSER